MINPSNTEDEYQTRKYAVEYEKSEIDSAIANNDSQTLSFRDIHGHCYDLQYPEQEKAADLKEALLHDSDALIVTVWFRDFQNQWGQNLFNQDVRGTLWKLIWKYHPYATYTEADLSSYNDQSEEYHDLADMLGINLNNIYDGPTVTIMRNTFGQAYRSEKGPRDLIAKVDDYIQAKEKDVFNYEPLDYDIQREVLAKNKYEQYMPSSAVEIDPNNDFYGHPSEKAPLEQTLHIKQQPKLKDLF